MCGAELDVDRVAEDAREEEPRLGADRRAGDRDLLPVRGDAHLDRVRVVARRAEALLGDGDPVLGGEDRGVDPVDALDLALERAAQRGDREQPRVVRRERPVGGDDDRAWARRRRARPRGARAGT